MKTTCYMIGGPSEWEKLEFDHPPPKIKFTEHRVVYKIAYQRITDFINIAIYIPEDDREH